MQVYQLCSFKRFCNTRSKLMLVFSDISCQTLSGLTILTLSQRLLSYTTSVFLDIWFSMRQYFFGVALFGSCYMICTQLGLSFHKSFKFITKIFARQSHGRVSNSSNHVSVSQYVSHRTVRTEDAIAAVDQSIEEDPNVYVRHRIAAVPIHLT